MPHAFDADTVSAVLRHMNSDHTDDNLLIARAFGRPPTGWAALPGWDCDGGARGAAGAAGTASAPLWAGAPGPVRERPEVRREVVALYDAACAALGVEARPHA